MSDEKQISADQKAPAKEDATSSRTPAIRRLLSLYAGLFLIGFAGFIAWGLFTYVSQRKPAEFTFYEVILFGIALVVSVLTGVVSGFLPAWRAARMDPVDALRSE